MERKPCVFASFRGQLELLNCISRVSEGSELTALQRLGQAGAVQGAIEDVLAVENEVVPFDRADVLEQGCVLSWSGTRRGSTGFETKRSWPSV